METEHFPLKVKKDWQEAVLKVKVQRPVSLAPFKGDKLHRPEHLKLTKYQVVYGLFNPCKKKIIQYLTLIKQLTIIFTHSFLHKWNKPDNELIHKLQSWQ